ncbi:hypothetical protein [Anaerosacchariphilus polymeriproducens]|uniref:Sigma-70 family RNA polymerase sigma factor n=1 Tax=Anaerosacchariphilus polymeriproducens TaxID=1812858 RepID=A0A371AS05_9FIRM|nr:hypothetical protein [Anaerosacchariphilus polymeriproducens]RDU22338.1 hypothetical protein DWV06_13655 [Anaerosacchariphilus polymeriproducens]
MIGNLVTNISKYRKGEKEALYPIIKKMNPLINKYTKKLFHLEPEDVKQEFYISIIESINNIHTYSDERQCFNYIKNAILYKFMKLYRDSVEYDTFYLSLSNIELDKIYQTKNYLKDCIFLTDFKEKTKDLSTNKRIILEGKLFKEMSDLELANYLNVSRQYVNRVKKNIFITLYKNEIINL